MIRTLVSPSRVWLGFRPRFPWASALGPSSRYLASSRRICRTLKPNTSLASACLRARTGRLLSCPLGQPCREPTPACLSENARSQACSLSWSLSPSPDLYHDGDIFTEQL